MVIIPCVFLSFLLGTIGFYQLYYIPNLNLENKKNYERKLIGDNIDKNKTLFDGLNLGISIIEDKDTIEKDFEKVSEYNSNFLYMAGQIVEPLNTDILLKNITNLSQILDVKVSNGENQVNRISEIENSDAKNFQSKTKYILINILEFYKDLQSKTNFQKCILPLIKDRIDLNIKYYNIYTNFANTLSGSITRADNIAGASSLLKRNLQSQIECFNYLPVGSGSQLTVSKYTEFLDIITEYASFDAQFAKALKNQENIYIESTLMPQYRASKINDDTSRKEFKEVFYNITYLTRLDKQGVENYKFALDTYQAEYTNMKQKYGF